MTNNPMENPVIRQLLERKSMRVFEKEAMPQEDVRAILAAAVQAPTAGNMTLWTAIHVTDEEKNFYFNETWSGHVKKCKELGLM